LEVSRQFYILGFNLITTRGTHRFLAEQSIESEPIFKMHE